MMKQLLWILALLSFSHAIAMEVGINSQLQKAVGADNRKEIKRLIEEGEDVNALYLNFMSSGNVSAERIVLQ